MLIAKLHRLSLPSRRVSDRASLPHAPGCYYVFRGWRLLYVGRAEKSIRTRWRGHDELPNLRQSDRVHYWRMWAVLVRDREAVDIRKFRPPLNGRMEPRDWRGRVVVWLVNLGCLAMGGAIAWALCVA